MAVNPAALSVGDDRTLRQNIQEQIDAAQAQIATLIALQRKLPDVVLDLKVGELKRLLAFSL